MRELLEQVLAIAKAADDAIMAVYGRAFEVTVKQDNSPLTEADRAAHDVIRQGLQALPQGYPILSEEDVEGFSGVGDDGRYWLVDPLDGTKEFIKRNDEFTVNIALIEHGAPILGVVTAPALGVAYIAADGMGAFRIDADGQRHVIQVAGKPSPGSVWRVLGSRSHASPALSAWLETLGAYEIQPMGSSLKSCLRKPIQNLKPVICSVGIFVARRKRSAPAKHSARSADGGTQARAGSCVPAILIGMSIAYRLAWFVS